MSEYGVKIKNIEAATLYEYNLGIRQRYLAKDGMFTNSLLLDFLKKNGLRITKGGFTKDIICLTFNMNAKPKADHIEKLKKAIDSETDPNRIEYLADCLAHLENISVIFNGLSKEQIRLEYYKDGVDIPYYRYHKDTDEYLVDEVIHYRMFFRSTGKAKQGSCMFINDRLYNKAIDFIRMGIKLPKEDAPIVEISAYSSLIASTIIGKIQIDPKNILILKDVKSSYTAKVISVEADEKNRCVAKIKENYTNSYDMFDGQALIDSSIFPSWANGYVLLRQHFCKMASFNTNIQGFFKDYFGDNYETAKVVDMFGNEHYAKDIKIITTNNAVKWIKFDISYDYWCQKVNECNNEFGIVKTAHESKLGDFQRMSYQMINSLDMNVIPNIAKKSFDYVYKLRTDDTTYLDYLERTKNFSNDHEVMIALYRHNTNIMQSDYFRIRRTTICDNYVRDIKQGHVIQDGDNVTLVGSPYAMLLHSIGEDVEKDIMFQHEDNTIQCYTERFEDGEYLAGFRSPYNSKSNCCYLHNVKNKDAIKYFNFGTLIMAVNTLHTDYEDRGNGLDFDSDSQYITNQADIVECARKYYLNNPTIVNNIAKSKISHSSDLADFAKMDNSLAKSQLGIGESTNIAQIAQSYGYTFDDKDYEMYNALLATICQCCIDNAKRTFAIDINAEIKRIKEELDIKTNGLPKFWKTIKGQDGVDYSEKINYNIQCPMNTLQDMYSKVHSKQSKAIPLLDFCKNEKYKQDYKKNRQVEEFLKKYEIDLFKYSISDNKKEDILWLKDSYDDLIYDLSRIGLLSKKYINVFDYFIRHTFGNQNKTSIKNKRMLLSVLYKMSAQSNNLLSLFVKG